MLEDIEILLKTVRFGPSDSDGSAFSLLSALTVFLATILGANRKFNKGSHPQVPIVKIKTFPQEPKGARPDRQYTP
jgi:hypothetical protein